MDLDHMKERMGDAAGVVRKKARRGWCYAKGNPLQSILGGIAIAGLIVLVISLLRDDD